MRRICARLRGLRDLDSPLIASGGNWTSGGDIEMFENSVDSDSALGVEVYVVSAPILKHLSIWALAAFFFCGRWCWCIRTPAQ